MNVQNAQDELSGLAAKLNVPVRSSQERVEQALGMNEQQIATLDRLEARHPATSFTVIEQFFCDAVLVEYDDVESAGQFMLKRDGKRIAVRRPADNVTS